MCVGYVMEYFEKKILLYVYLTLLFMVVSLILEALIIIKISLSYEIPVTKSTGDVCQEALSGWIIVKVNFRGY